MGSCGIFADIQKFGKNCFFSLSFFRLPKSIGFHVHSFCQKSDLLLSGPCFKSCQADFCANPFTGFALREGMAMKYCCQMITFLAEIFSARVQRLEKRAFYKKVLECLWLIRCMYSELRRNAFSPLSFNYLPLISYMEGKSLAQYSDFLTWNLPIAG